MPINELHKIKPVPPGNAIRQAGHHWLKILDYDRHSFGLIVLQWSPAQKEWFHSGGAGGIEKPINVSGWQYIAECPLPPIEIS